MERREVVRRRLDAVGLGGTPVGGCLDVVERLVAVQAQDFGPAKWSIAQRTPGVSNAQLDQAFSDGELLRTHVLRPTWHFVRPGDLRWLLELTAPRVHALNRHYRDKEGLDAATLDRAADVIGSALAGGDHLTKRELVEQLGRAGLELNPMRVTLLVMHVELEGLICSGRVRGKQQTYALLDERVPAAAEAGRPRGRAAMVRELARRYFTGHGPATVNDFTWWSSLRVADVTPALAQLGDHLVSEQVDGVTYWSGTVDAAAATGAVSEPAPGGVRLIQVYDEYLVGYRESKVLVDLARRAQTRPEGYPFNLQILLDGQIAGSWRRTITKSAVRIEVTLLTPFTAAQLTALRAEAERHGRFLELSTELSVELTTELSVEPS